MATIEDLVLTVSRNTNNQVAVKVSYTIHFSEMDRYLRVPYNESVELWEREGVRDVDMNDPLSFYMMNITPSPPDKPDKTDRFVSGICDGYVGPDPTLANPVWDVISGPIVGVEKLLRSWEKTLTAAEVTQLRDPGREHPYVRVGLHPMGIKKDSKTVELVIDIGDPNE